MDQLRATLTVIVPTYCRRESACRLANELLKESATHRLSIVFLDDHSHDGTFDSLRKISDSFPSLTVLRNNSNMGFARTVLRGFQASSTNWIMLMADDDNIVPGALGNLLDFISDTELEFIAPQYIGPDKMYRNGGRTRLIRPSELRYSANLAPGLVIRRQVFVRLHDLLERLLAEESNALTTYPQVILAADCIARRKASWLASPTVAQGDSLPSGIKDVEGRHYADPLARLAQEIDFKFALDELVRQAKGKRSRYRRRIRSMMDYSSSMLLVAISDLMSSLSHHELDGRKMLLAAVLGPSVNGKRVVTRLSRVHTKRNS